MTVSRVRYRERQTLRHSDLNDEQAYLLEMRRRHAIAHHRWGIVSGLTLTAPDGEVRIAPGMAVDGYGRELIVPNAIVIAEAILDERFPTAATIGVSLVYGRIAETTPQSGRWDCGTGQENRWIEVALVRLTGNGEAPLPGRASEDSSDLDLAVAPADDPGREWPVFLGRIERTTAGTTIGAADRPLAGLVGETVIAPSARARLQVGSGLDQRRFAVGIRDAGGAFVERLVIDRASDVTFRGHVTVTGDVKLYKGKEGATEASGVDVCDPCWHLRLDVPPPEAPSSGVYFDALATAPAAAAPWQIYRASATVAGRTVNRLQVEIGHPGTKGDPTRYRLAIGRCMNDQFQPCLVVGADCTVTVPGTLTVEGQVIRAPVRPDPDDPRFTQEMLTRWLGGLTSAAAAVEAVYGSGLAVAIDVAPQMWTGETLTYTLKVDNIGHTALTNLTLYQSITFDNEQVAVPAVVDLSDTSPIIPGAKSEREIKTNYRPTNPGKIRIAITLLAVGPASNVVPASGQADVAVETQGPQ